MGYPDQHEGEQERTATLSPAPSSTLSEEVHSRRSVKSAYALPCNYTGIFGFNGAWSADKESTINKCLFVIVCVKHSSGC